MAKGDPFLSPWFSEFADSRQRKITLSVNFDDDTRAVTSVIVRRDKGCSYKAVVLRPRARAFDNPHDAVKRLAAPADVQADALGVTTIEQAMALQITAEP